MKRGWFFDSAGKIRFVGDHQHGYADEVFCAPNCVYSSKKIARERRNEWLPKGLEAARKEKARINKEKMYCNRVTRSLLKIQRKLEKYPPGESNGSGKS